MTRTIRALALACALPLAGCQSVDVASAQRYAVQACSYEPTAETVLAIAGTVSGYSTDVATQVGRALCAAVLTGTAQYAALKPGARKAAPKGVPSVNGVPVKGRFVTKR